MKKLVPVLMVLLAAASIAAVYLLQEVRNVRKQTDELKTHVTELQAANLAAASSPLPPAPVAANLQPVAGALSGAAPAPSTAPGTPAAEKKQGNALEGLARQMLGTPEGQEMMKMQLRMILPQQYPDIGKELGLTPADTEKLFDLLVKQQMAVSTGGLNILAGEQSAAELQEMQRKVQEAQRAGQAEIAAMLGDKMPKYQEYQRTLPMRQQVSQLQASLGSGNNALSDSQVKPLITALAAEQARIQQDRRNAPRPQPQAQLDQQARIEQQLQRAAEDSNRMVEAARSYLNPQQLDGYRQLLEQQQNLQRTLLRGIGSQLAPQNGGAQPAAPARP